MPEAAVYKKAGLVFTEDNVGLAGQFLVVKPVSVPFSVQEFPDQ